MYNNIGSCSEYVVLYGPVSLLRQLIYEPVGTACEALQLVLGDTQLSLTCQEMPLPLTMFGSSQCSWDMAWSRWHRQILGTGTKLFGSLSSEGPGPVITIKGRVKRSSIAKSAVCPISTCGLVRAHVDIGRQPSSSPLPLPLPPRPQCYCASTI
jgi:hypothetical protein